jgi:membrane protease YdiL (CAAX protease family)
MRKIWNALWPLFIYPLAQTVFGVVGVLLLGEKAESFALVFLLISIIICIPFYYKMYCKDKVTAEEEKRNLPIGNKDYFAIIITGAAIAVAMNNIISITPLPYLFPGYEETNEILLSGGMMMQIATVGILGCVVEEICHRGVVYCRMRRCLGKRKAMIFSALVFGIYHMNVVQAVYAFFLGLFFAWVYERYKTLWAPITAHMSANLFVILFGSSKAVNHALDSMVGYCLITCISILIFYYGWRFMKQTDPMVELEFVEKEPDTLKSLTEEYKEQEREGE